jgi:hypothetical protein
MNLTHTPFRNRLQAEKVDKICYIHINRRILDQKKVGREKTGERLDQLNDEEALELEESVPIVIVRESTTTFPGSISLNRK